MKAMQIDNKRLLSSHNLLKPALLLLQAAMTHKQKQKKKQDKEHGDGCHNIRRVVRATVLGINDNGCLH